MSTLHFNQTTSLRPDQFVAGLTDFGSGRSDGLQQGDRGPQQRDGPVMSRRLNAQLLSTSRIELAHRSTDSLDVTLVWVHGDGADEAVVCVCDRENGAYFEIPAAPYLALDVYYHPFAYRDFSTLDYADSRLAA